MAGYLSGDARKVTTHRLIEMKERGEKASTTEIIKKMKS